MENCSSVHPLYFTLGAIGGAGGQEEVIKTLDLFPRFQKIGVFVVMNTMAGSLGGFLDRQVVT